MQLHTATSPWPLSLCYIKQEGGGGAEAQGTSITCTFLQLMPMLDADADALLLPLSRCSRGWPSGSWAATSGTVHPCARCGSGPQAASGGSSWGSQQQPGAAKRAIKLQVSSVIGITGPAPKKDVVWCIFIRILYYAPLAMRSGQTVRHQLVSSTTKG
jgi:hypothetical protein